MSCPRNIKKWWFLKLEGPHQWKTYWVGVWSFGEFEVEAECELCGTRKKDFGLSAADIIRQGYSPEKARATGSYYCGYGYNPSKEIE